MAKQTTRTCDFCGTEIEQVAAKLYMAPVLPGKASTSFMSGYSHWADVCAECVTGTFIPKMTKRQSSNGTATKKKTRKKSRT